MYSNFSFSEAEHLPCCFLQAWTIQGSPAEKCTIQKYEDDEGFSCAVYVQC